jgi:hypothetical protein
MGIRVGAVAVAVRGVAVGIVSGFRRFFVCLEICCINLGYSY